MDEVGDVDAIVSDEEEVALVVAVLKEHKGKEEAHIRGTRSKSGPVRGAAVLVKYMAGNSESGGTGSGSI